ncbi:MAG TPA: PAS domain S-box protein [Pyrinomonadaceae bacterium]|nr:PAS domain S-box protein [Pyrinomonadaceae bacterium]
MSDSKHQDFTTPPHEAGLLQREMQATLASLRESNQTLEAIIHASPLAIITLDPDGIVKMWNSAAERIYGWSEQEVLGRPLPTVPPDRQEEMRQNHRRALAGTDFTAYETERLRKDGTQISVSISTAPLSDAEGRLKGVVALVEDITERKRAEREKSQLAAEVDSQRRRLDSIIKSVPGVVWEAWGEPDESSQRIDFVSDYVEKLLGYTVEEWLSTPNFWLTIVHPEDRERAARTAAATFASGEIGTNQFRWMTKTGRAVWVEAQSVAIMDASGRPVGMRGVTMDITERKEAGEALRRSEERYRAFLEQSSEPIWRFEMSAPIRVNLPAEEQIELFYELGYLAECNDVMARMYGYASASELIGVRLETLLPRTPANLDYLRAAVHSGYRLTDVESQELDRDGQTKYFLNNLVGIVEGGALMRVWGTQRDISERKRVEEELRHWEQICQHAGWGVAMGDPATGTLKALNPAFARMHGYTVEELIGRPLADTFAPEERPKLDEHIRAVAERGHHIYESMHIRKDGTRFPVLADVTAFKDEHGNVLYRAANIQDITERRRAEEAERFLADATTIFTSSLEYEQTLASVARRAVPYVADYCLVHMLEEDGSIRRMIVAHQDPAREAAWRDMQRRFPLDLNTPHTIAKVLRTGRAEIFSAVSDELMQQVIRNPVEISMLKEFDIKASMIVPLVARGRTIGALTFISSESARHYTDDDLALATELARRAAFAIDNARLYRRAQEANRAKDEFLATLSHELRTPLTPIIGWVHMMGTGQLTPADITHGLAVISKNSQSLSRLINDLLDMSAILSGKMRIDTLPVSLDATVKEAIETVRPQAAKQGIKIELAPCAGLEEVFVSGDRMRLVQVFWNLLTNAVKFSPDNSRVKVICEMAGGAQSVLIHIEDEGEGIRPEFLPHVFERFRQQDMSTTKMHGGLGIGLALVKSFIEAHGGTVAASSAGEGRGSRFTVLLPLLQTQAVASAAPHIPAEATCEIESACHALLIEDAPDTLEMLRVAFEVRGFRTSACATPEEALAIAANEHFDIIISDIGLPDIDGYELLRRLRSETPRLRDVPALALTGYAAQKDVDAALAAGFSAHLAKPFDPATLAATVDALLNRHTSDPPDADERPRLSRS